MADGLRRLDGVADVMVDLQANLCTVTPARDRLPDLGGFGLAVHAAGYRPARLWIEARGAVAERDGKRWFTIAGSSSALVLDGEVPVGDLLIGRVEPGPPFSIVPEAVPR